MVITNVLFTFTQRVVVETLSARVTLLPVEVWLALASSFVIAGHADRSGRCTVASCPSVQKERTMSGVTVIENFLSSELMYLQREFVQNHSSKGMLHCSSSVQDYIKKKI